MSLIFIFLYPFKDFRPALFSARTRIIYVVSVLIWTLHKLYLASNFIFKCVLFQNYKVKMSGDQEPHTNGLNGDASDEEVSPGEIL